MTDKPLDYSQDLSGRETHRLVSLFPQPDFVKNASQDRLRPDAAMPRHMYADQKNKLYPCHTAPATWMSALFFADKKANFDEKTAADISSRIRRAAKYFGISSLISELESGVEKTAAAGADALSDENFAVVWRDEHGNVERHWPLRNATEVKFAADHFAKYRDDFVFNDRHHIAVRILEKAAQYEADVSEHLDALEFAAGFGMCAAKTASELLRNRAKLVYRKSAELSAELVKLADAVDQNPDMARSQETRLKLAAVIDECDRSVKLSRLYDAGGLPRPEEVLFAVTEKVANDFLQQNVETTTGNVYALEDLEKLAVNDVREWLGDEFADAVSAGGVYMDRDKLAAIVPTLDRGMAAMLDRLMIEKRASVVVKNPATDSILSLDRLFELAASAE